MVNKVPSQSRTVVTAGKTYTVHELKSIPSYFRAVDDRIKTFELRRDDRGFHAGDRLHLREWLPAEKEYTGASLVAEVTYLIRDNQYDSLKPGFVCMAISVL